MLEMKRLLSCTKREARLYDVPFEVLVEYQIYYTKKRYSVYTDDDKPTFEKFLQDLPEFKSTRVRLVEAFEHQPDLTSQKLDQAIYYNHLNPEIPDHFERLTQRVFIRP